MAHSTTTSPASRPAFRTCECGTDFLPPFPNADKCRECHRRALAAALKRGCACGAKFIPPANAPDAQRCQRCYRAAKAEEVEAQRAIATQKKRQTDRAARAAQIRELYLRGELQGDKVRISRRVGKRTTQVVVSIRDEGSYTFYVS
jgi:hypothetical protein